MKRWGVIAATVVAALAAGSADASVLLLKSSGTITSTSALPTQPYGSAEPQIGTSVSIAVRIDTSSIRTSDPATAGYSAFYRLASPGLVLTVGGMSYSFDLPVSLGVQNNLPSAGPNSTMDQISISQSVMGSTTDYDIPFSFDQPTALFLSFGITDPLAKALSSTTISGINTDLSAFSYQGLSFWAYNLKYNFTFNSNNMVTSISAESDVPEPATWALMLIGFGGVGSTMRRRKPVTISANIGGSI